MTPSRDRGQSRRAILDRQASKRQALAFAAFAIGLSHGMPRLLFP